MHCIRYCILSAGGVTVTNSSLPESSAFHSLSSANLPSHRKNCCDFEKCVGTKSQTLFWGQKRGFWCCFISQQISFSVIAAVWHTCCSPYRSELSLSDCHFRVSSRSFSVGKLKEMETFRKGIFRPHDTSFLQPSLNLCLFYITFILSVCFSLWAKWSAQQFKSVKDCSFVQ